MSAKGKTATEVGTEIHEAIERGLREPGQYTGKILGVGVDVGAGPDVSIVLDVEVDGNGDVKPKQAALVDHKTVSGARARFFVNPEPGIAPVPNHHIQAAAATRIMAKQAGFMQNYGADLSTVFNALSKSATELQKQTSEFNQELLDRRAKHWEGKEGDAASRRRQSARDKAKPLEKALVAKGYRTLKDGEFEQAKGMGLRVARVAGTPGYIHPDDFHYVETARGLTVPEPEGFPINLKVRPVKHTMVHKLTKDSEVIFSTSRKWEPGAIPKDEGAFKVDEGERSKLWDKAAEDAVVKYNERDVATTMELLKKVETGLFGLDYASCGKEEDDDGADGRSSADDEDRQGGHPLGRGEGSDP